MQARTFALALACAFAAAPAGAQPPPERDKALAERVTLELALEYAAANNPGIAAEQARAVAASARERATGRLSDPELRYQRWAAPLLKPWTLGMQEMNMLGVQQSFPAHGSLAAERDAARADREAAELVATGAALDVSAEVQRAFADYYAQAAEHELHQAHLAVAEQIVELVRARYVAGMANQADVLRAALDKTRLEDAIVRVDADHREAAARLNAALGREAEAPLGPPAEPPVPELPPKIAELEERMHASLPEVKAAAKQTDRWTAMAEGSRAMGRFPMFMVGVDYMRMQGEHDPNGFSLMLSMTLPWLNPRYDEEAKAALAERQATEKQVQKVAQKADYELAAARADLDASLRSLLLIRTTLSTDSERAFEAARDAYASGTGSLLALLESSRTLLDVRLEKSRALARACSAAARLARAVGAQLPKDAHHD